MHDLSDLRFSIFIDKYWMICSIKIKNIIFNGVKWFMFFYYQALGLYVKLTCLYPVPCKNICLWKLEWICKEKENICHNKNGYSLV